MTRPSTRDFSSARTCGVEFVVDRVHGVEAQAVDLVVPRPQLGVLDRPLAHAALGIVERLAPERLVAVGEVRAEGGDRLRAGPDVVVDDVEDHREALAVCGVDEARESVRPAVRRMRREGVEPVVAPVAIAGERRNGHRLDRRHAELAQLREARDHAVERPLARERSDVQLVDHELVEARLRAGRDVESARVEDAGRPTHSLRLPARARIGPRCPVHDEEVVVAGPRGHVPGPGPVVGALELVFRRTDAHRDGAGIRRPDDETRLGQLPTGIAPSSCTARGYPSGTSDRLGSVIRQEFANLMSWEDRHKLLLAAARRWCSSPPLRSTLVGSVLVYRFRAARALHRDHGPSATRCSSRPFSCSRCPRRSGIR